MKELRRIYIYMSIYSDESIYIYILDTNSADEKRTRNKQKRDVFSTLRPFKLMLSSECDIYIYIYNF